MKMDLRTFRLIKPHYSGATPWSPYGATAFVFCVLLATLFGVPQLKGAIHSLDPSIASVFLPIVQYSLIIIIVWLAAGAYGADRLQVLALHRSSQDINISALAVSAAISFLLPASFVMRNLLSSPLEVTDQALGPVTLSQIIIQGTVYIVLAPIAEEMLFRGFFLSALQKTRLGFWRASIVVTFLWSAMHFNYPGYAIETTVIAGMVFSCVLWITGSLRQCIIAHSIFNAYSFLLSLFLLLVSYFA